MKEFMYIIRGGHESVSEKSPEEMQKHMEDWQKWMGNLVKSGNLLGGQPLEGEGKTLVESGTKVMDRPLVEGKELVGGYLIMKATNLEGAVQLANGCPGFEHGCTIEVREIRPM